MKNVVSRHGTLFAEFASPEQARGAYIELRARGYARLETYSPYPLTKEQQHGPESSTGLGIIVFALALFGAVTAYLVQWYVNVDRYPLNIGGRPTHAVLAFIPATFETLLLFGALACFVGVLILLRLPRLWRPELEIDGFERAGIDRHWVVVGLGSGGGDLDRTTRELRALHPLRIVHVMDEA